MYCFLTFILTLALGIRHSLAATQYVPDEDGLPVTTSVNPCYLLGDPDLYGLGVRVAFYISFGTCLVAILFGLFDELKTPRLSFNVLFATLLIILVRNVYQGSFAIFEWFIVTGLAVVSGGSATYRLPTFIEEVDDKKSNDTGLKGDGDDKEETSEAHMTGAKDPERHADDEPSLGDNVTPAGSSHRRSHDIEAKAGVGEKEEELSEEAKFVKEYAHENQRILLSGPISLGFSYLLYAIFALMQPWLYFTQTDSGHRQGCAVPMVFFGTFDMYNPHWQRWLKAQAVLGVFVSLGFLPFGIGFIIFGSRTRRFRAAALAELDNKVDQRLKEAKQRNKELKEEMEKHRQEKQQEKQEPQPDMNPGKGTSVAPKKSEGVDHKINKLKKQVNQDETKKRTWKQIRAQVANNMSPKDVRYYIWGLRIFATLLVGVFFGALPIYFIERTIQLNHVDLGSDLADSSGQMLALLVAVLTSVSFVMQVIGNYTEARKRRKELENVLVELDRKIGQLISTIEGRIADARKNLQDLNLQKWFQDRRSPQDTSTSGRGTTEARSAASASWLSPSRWRHTADTSQRP